VIAHPETPRRASAAIAGVAFGVVLALGVLAATAVAGTSGPAGRAGVRSASLRQRGRRLDWTVALVHGLSPHGLTTGRRSLCLLLERPASGAVDGRLCLAARSGHRTRGRLGLSFARVRGSDVGAARTVRGSARRTDGGRRVTASFTPAALGRRYRPLRWQTSSSAVGPGCPAVSGARMAAARSRGGRAAALPTCTVAYPARHRVLARLHVPRLVGCVARGPSIVYGGSPARREIALTFDDGPWDEPPTIDFVNLLAREHVPATFFEIGDQIHEFDPTGAIERRMLADGDMIGDHTWTHPNMEALSPPEQTSELELTADAIHHATGFTPCLWRPPYGSVDSALESLARGLGFLTIYWNDDPRDWSLPGVGSIVSTAVNEARNGGIVEMHFGGGPRVQTLDALPTIISTLRGRGYRFVNLVQMLGLREIWR
jgi:peptidoglycan/xylan/chitin deacetylase (PgdA/CDA1 family)